MPIKINGQIRKNIEQCLLVPCGPSGAPRQVMGITVGGVPLGEEDFEEHGHDERAGLGQEHHDGAVHDGQAPAPASSKHWCL